MVGRAGAGGSIVFTISVDGSGTVTLDQLRSVVHNDPAGPRRAWRFGGDSSAANLVTLTATITDGDGDTNTAVANIGGSFQFEDDGPSISAAGAIPTLAVDETDFATNASASFAGLFAPDFGADGSEGRRQQRRGGCGRDHLCAGCCRGSVRAGRHADQFGGEPFAQRRGCRRPQRGRQQPCVHDTVDASGTVTLDQLRSVVHNDPADPDEPGASAATLAANW